MKLAWVREGMSTTLLRKTERCSPHVRFGIKGRIIIQLILQIYSVRMCIGITWNRILPVEDQCAYGNKPSGLIKDGKALYQLRDYDLPESDCMLYS
jgi:hypothetical protein